MLEDFLQEHPDSVEALRELTQVALEENKFAEAEECLRKVLKHYPNDYRSLHTLHGCVLRLGRKAEARKLAEQLERVRRFERQLDDLLRVKLRARPKDPEVRYQIGFIYEQLGLQTQASQWFLRALTVSPFHTEALKGMVRYHEERGEKEKANQYRAGITQRDASRPPAGQDARPQ